MLLILCGLAAPLAAQTEDYAIDWYSLDCGGGTSADGEYAVSGTIGQWDAGEIAGSEFSMLGGFWAVEVDSELEVVPTLSITFMGEKIVVSWPVTATTYYLEATSDLFQPNRWHRVGQPVVVINGQNTVTLPASDGTAYFRLTDKPGSLQLTIARSGTNVVLSWPAWATGYLLEQNRNATQSNGWSQVGAPIVESDGLNNVTLSAASAQFFFRLTQTPGRPALTITLSGTNVILSWAISSTVYFLEQNSDLTQPDGWSLVGAPVIVSNGLYTVTVPLAGSMNFFWLTPVPTKPPLAIRTSGNSVVLSWPAAVTGYVLEQNLDVTQPGHWTQVGSPVVVVDGQNTVTQPMVDSAFFRLKRVTSGGP